MTDLRARVRALAAVGALSLLAACFSVGSQFPSAPVGKIEKGVTTKKQVRRMFGEPFRTGVDAGYETWEYNYGRWQIWGTTKSKALMFIFNKDGTVRTYTYTSNLDGRGDGGDEDE